MAVSKTRFLLTYSNRWNVVIEAKSPQEARDLLMMQAAKAEVRELRQVTAGAFLPNLKPANDII